MIDFKLIKKNGSAFVFTDGKNTFTLWNGHNHRYWEYWTCYITPEKNKKYRTTKYRLNSNSIYVWITIKQMPLEFRYFPSYICITTLQKYLWLIKFYNKINIKKTLNRVKSITKVFQTDHLVRYISEFL